MAASEIRRAIVGRIPDCLRNCVNKEYFPSGGVGVVGAGGYPVGAADGMNGGYYAAGGGAGVGSTPGAGTLPVQQAHSTTPHEVPHSVTSAVAPPPPQPPAPQPPGLPHSLVSFVY